MADISKITPLGSTTTYNLKDNSAVSSVGISGTSVIVTKRDNSTSSFSIAAASAVTSSWAITAAYAGTAAWALNGRQASCAGYAASAGAVAWNNVTGKPGNTTVSWENGTTAGPVVSIYAITSASAAIPAATTAVSGIITTQAQTFAGNKTFPGTLTSTTFVGALAGTAGNAISAGYASTANNANSAAIAATATWAVGMDWQGITNVPTVGVGWIGNTTTGPSVAVSFNGGTATSPIPAAGTAASGVMTTTTQYIAGGKIFIGALTASAGITMTTATGALSGTASNAINAAHATTAHYASSATYASTSGYATYALYDNDEVSNSSKVAISSKYVKKTGDTMNGGLTITKAGESFVRLQNTTTGSVHQITLATYNSGNAGIYDNTNDKYIIYANLTGQVIVNAPLLNGIVTLTSATYGTTLPAAGKVGRIFFKKV